MAPKAQLLKFMPPVSSWWAQAPAQAMWRPSWKMGATMDTSGWWIAPRYGSLRMNMSPSRMPGFFAQLSMMLRITVDMVPEWNSTCGPITTMEPSAR